MCQGVKCGEAFSFFFFLFRFHVLKKNLRKNERTFVLFPSGLLKGRTGKHFRNFPAEQARQSQRAQTVRFHWDETKQNFLTKVCGKGRSLNAEHSFQRFVYEQARFC